MWKTLGGVIPVVLVFAAGCFGSMRHGVESRAVQDIQRIGEEAEKVLAYMEGRETVPPDLGPSSPRKGLWEGTGFAERRPTITRLKALGCLAENNKGRLELRKCDGLGGSKEQNAAQKLLAEENKDRKAVYKRVAESNKDGRVSVSRVERIYVLKRLSHAAPGHVFQLPSGGEDLESLRSSAVGQRLGGQCAADAWVIIP